MTRPTTVRVHDIIGGPLCVSAEDGQRLHDKILPLLKADTPIVLSFESVDTIISAFLNPAIGQLYGELSEDDIGRLLSVHDMADDDREILDRVIENAVAYFNSPEEFDKAWQEETGDDEYDDDEYE